MGGKNLIVSANPDGILVSDKEQSSCIKPFVDAIDQQVMFAEKSWGSFRVMDVGKKSLTVKLSLDPGHRMSYHSHERRAEIWTVISGSGRVILDGVEKLVSTGDVINLPAGCKHTVIASESGLQMIEVQIGTDINASDKKKFFL